MLNKQAIQHPKRDGGHCKEVQGCDDLAVIPKKGQPEPAGFVRAGQFFFGMARTIV
jgi:hypothetical protein